MSTRTKPEPLTAGELRQALDRARPDWAGHGVWLAYSGGVDSQVLLDLLDDLRQQLAFPLTAIHIHHGLHPEADRWLAHCRDTCRARGIEFLAERVEVVPAGQGVEAAARTARYQSLARHLQPNDSLLTAHHQDDQAETLLLQLLRGSGVSGLASMPVATALGRGWHLRPMLDFTRARIEATARANGLEWVEDSSNRDGDIRRSFLRTEILPRLAGHWPAAGETLARTAAHMAEADGLLGEMAEQDLPACLGDDGASLSLAALQGLSGPRRRNLLRYWLHRHGLGMPSARQLAELERQIDYPSRTAQALVQWGEGGVRRYRDRLLAVPEVVASDTVTDELSWDMQAPLPLPVSGWRLRAEPGTGQGLARKRLQGPVTVRFRRGGERCRLPGREHHNDLKGLMQSAGLPPWERPLYPLVYVGKELAAIGDRWVCAPYAAVSGEDALVLHLDRSQATVG